MYPLIFIKMFKGFKAGERRSPYLLLVKRSLAILKTEYITINRLPEFHFHIFTWHNEKQGQSSIRY